MLATKYSAEIKSILEKYPQDQKRSAVLPLMFLAQREYGSVTSEATVEIADLLDMEATQVASLIGFYTLLHEEPGGKYRIQVCTDLPCALRGAGEFVEKLCQQLDIQKGGTTSDGTITVEEVMCIAGCDKAPTFQLQDRDGIHYHECQTVESAMELISQLREDEDDA